MIMDLYGESVTEPAVASVVERAVPLPHDIVRSVTLHQTGGEIAIPEAGFHLRIPRAAIGNQPITITVRALKGSRIAYVFGPHGILFRSPIEMTQSLEHTNMDAAQDAPLEGGYFLDGDLDPAAGTAYVREFIPVAVRAEASRIHMPITHFSGYVLSSGRLSSSR